MIAKFRFRIYCFKIIGEKYSSPPLANMLLNCNLYTLVPFIDRYVVQNMICLHFSISLFIATFPLINLGRFCDPTPHASAPPSIAVSRLRID